MRSGETLRRDTVRFLLAAIQTEEKARLGAAVDKLVAEGKDETARRSWLAQNKPGELDDAAVTEVLTRPAKLRRASMDALRKGEDHDPHPRSRRDDVRRGRQRGEYRSDRARVRREDRFARRGAAHQRRGARGRACRRPRRRDADSLRTRSVAP